MERKQIRVRISKNCFLDIKYKTRNRKLTVVTDAWLHTSGLTIWPADTIKTFATGKEKKFISHNKNILFALSKVDFHYTTNVKI